MIKVIELFSGLGSQTQSLKNIGVDHKVVGISEIDKYCLISYEALHGKTHNFGNICDIKELPDADLWTYSFPCLTGDTLVMTNKGYKKIVDVKIDDKVLTHTNTFKKVVNIQYTGNKLIYKIVGMGIDEIKATDNHKFYVRRKYRKGHKQVRLFTEPLWERVDRLDKNYYLGIAINQEAKFPDWQGIVCKWKDRNRSGIKNKISSLFTNHSFWWIVGRYIGDGWLRNQGGIIICCDKKELFEMSSHIRNCGYNYTIIEEKSTYNFHIADKELGEYLKQFGRGALNKTLTNDILDLPIDYIKSFLDGYISADGCVKGKYCNITSVSKNLIYSVAHCIAKAYKRPYSIYKTNTSKTKILDGRMINQHDIYELTFKLTNDKQDKAFYEKGYIWFPIKKIEKVGYEDVYDLEVELDHSFTANGVIVHNCQDISIAGKLGGITQGTRSGLLYEVERLLNIAKENGTLPKYLLLENVKNLVSKRFIDDYNKWLLFLESLGYKNYWQILNSKDYGIPQNRERVFCVSIRGDHSPFIFPKPQPLVLKLKDLLEHDVDEKYYLSQKMLNCFLSDGTGRYPRKERFIGNLTRKNKDVGNSVTTLAGNRPTDNFVIDKVVKLGNYTPSGHSAASVVDPNGIAPTVMENHGTVTSILLKEELCDKLINEGLVKEGDVVNHSYSTSRMNKPGIANNENPDCAPALTTRGDTLGVVVKEALPIKNATKKGYLLAEVGDAVDISGRMEYHRGTVQKGITQTITTSGGENVGVVVAGLRIRKLTPRECLRLMGWNDTQIDKIQQAGISQSQQYKQAGNGIVVQVLEAIFKNLFKGEINNE